MQQRALGRTGLQVSLLGLGGFHLLEVGVEDAKRIVHRYLDAGGNYVETAAGYGDGESERKIGMALAERGGRDTVVLATKCHARTAGEARQLIDRSLRNLGTDYVDVLFMHSVGTFSELEQILAPDGALRAAEEARREGKVRFIGISAHGWPDTLLAALDRYPFDVIMHTFNYFDRFNFPDSEGKLLPKANALGVGVVLMKPVADGFLYRSAEKAFHYAFSLPVSTVVAGCNTMEMLELDLRLAESYREPMTEEEKQELFRTAPELGTYVCRQCGQCEPAPGGLPLMQIFQLEGMFDRQMRDGVVRDAAEFALRDRLRHWFGLQEVARERYRALGVDPGWFDRQASQEARCPYGVPIVRKLKIAHYKLSGEPVLF